MKCAKHKENKRVAGNFEGLVCVKCAEGDEKKGDREFTGKDSDVVREFTRHGNTIIPICQYNLYVLIQEGLSGAFERGLRKVMKRKG